jgi:hypothetical protein
MYVTRGAQATLEKVQEVLSPKSKKSAGLAAKSKFFNLGSALPADLLKSV